MTEIASGEIRIDLDDKAALAGLRAIEERFDQTMARIDREEASVTIDADTAKFDTAVKQSERKLAGIDRRRATAELELQTAAFDDELKRAQLKLKRLEGEKAEIELEIRDGDVEQLDKEIAKARKEIKSLDGMRAEAHLELKWNKAEMKAAEARIKAIEARTQELEALTQKVYQEEERRAKKEIARQRQRQKVSESLLAQKYRELTAAEQEAHRMEALRNREIAQIPKMRLAYSSLVREVEALDVARRKAKRNPDAMFHLELKKGAVLEEMAALKARLAAIGEEPPVRIHIEPGADFGRRLRTTVREGFRRGGIREAAVAAGVLAGRDFSEGIVNSTRRALSTRVLLGGITGIGSKIGKALGGLSDMTVRLGPFTSTIRQAFVGLSVLAPIILDVVGALGSLVAVAGSAALGVGALTGGLVGGAIPAILGMGLVVKDTVQEFQAGKKATKAYQDAILKYGASSEQAAKKQKELQHVLGGVSKETANQFVLGQKLGQAWDKATKPAHASVWKAIGNALGVANNIMPMFAKNTNEAMSVAEKGTSRWLKGLDSVEGHATLNTLMQNFNKTLSPVMSGLGQLVGYFAKVSAYASGALPGLGRTFESWAKGINATADGSAAFKARIDKIIKSAKDVGRFFLAAGRFVKAFFAGGVDAGQGFVNTMTSALNRWTEFLNTTDGQNKLGRFFSEAVRGAEGLFATLAPITTSFVRWAALIAPVVRNLLDASAAVTGFVAQMLRLTGLNGPLTAIVTTLGVLWGIGKISAATRAVTEFTRALLGMAAAEKVAAVSGGAAAAGGGAAVAAGAARGAGTVRAAENVALAAGAARAAGGISKVAKAGGIATRILSGLGAATLGVSSVWAGAAIVAGGLGFGIYKLTTRTRDYEKTQKQAESATKAAAQATAQFAPLNDALSQAYITNKQALLGVRAAEKEVDGLRRQGKTGTDAYTQAVLNLRQQQLNLKGTHAQLKAVYQDDVQNYRNQRAASEATLKTREKEIKQLREYRGTGNLYDEIAKKASEAGKSVTQYAKDLHLSSDQEKNVRKLADALGAQARAQTKAQQQAEAAAIAGLNQQRVLRNMTALSSQAAASLTKLSRAGGGKALTQKIAVKFSDSGDAQKVANSARATLKSGVPTKIVTKIVADSSNAEQAIRRLQRVRLTPARLEIVESGGKAALRTVERLAGTKVPKKDVPVVMHGGAEAVNVLLKLLGIKLPEKKQPVKQPGGPEAIGLLSRLASFRLPNITQRITIETIRIESVRRTGAASPGADTGRAAGKRPGEAGKLSLIGEGAADEYRVNTRTGEGYKTQGPEFTRLSMDDAIIPTEPKYKSRGRAIMQKVARDLGMNMFAAGAYKGKLDSKGYYTPSTNLGRAPTIPKKPKNMQRGSAGFTKRKGKAYHAGRDYIAYIAGLKGAQDDWEREVNIRQSQVKDPESLIVEAGRIVVNNPETGQPEDVGPRMVPNESGIAEYQASLAYVQQAFTQLLRVIQTLIAAIPQALAAIDLEDMYRKANIQNLNATISHEKGIIKAHSGGKNDNDKKIVSDHQRKLDAAEKALDHEHAQRDVIKEDRKTLVEDRREAGFSYRETTLEADKNQQEYNAVSGRAVSEAQSANDSSSGGGATGSGGSGTSGTGDTGQLSYEQQSALADTEKANVLRQFGGNTVGNIMGAILGSSPGGSGPGALNVALRSPSSGDFGAGSTSSGVAVSSGAGATAAFGAVAPAPSPTLSDTAAAGGVSRTVNITNNFQQPPPDPHTFVQGVQFEAQASL